MRIVVGQPFRRPARDGNAPDIGFGAAPVPNKVDVLFVGAQRDVVVVFAGGPPVILTFVLTVRLGQRDRIPRCG